MSEEENSKEIAVRQPQEIEIQQFEAKLLSVLSSYGLPVEKKPFPSRKGLFGDLSTTFSRV